MMMQGNRVWSCNAMRRMQNKCLKHLWLSLPDFESYCDILLNPVLHRPPKFLGHVRFLKCPILLASTDITKANCCLFFFSTISLFGLTLSLNKVWTGRKACNDDLPSACRLHLNKAHKLNFFWEHLSLNYTNSCSYMLCQQSSVLVSKILEFILCSLALFTVIFPSLFLRKALLLKWLTRTTTKKPW